MELHVFEIVCDIFCFLMKGHYWLLSNRLAVFTCTFIYIYAHTYADTGSCLLKDKSPQQTGFRLRVILLIRAADTIPLLLPPPYPSFSFLCCNYYYFN